MLCTILGWGSKATVAREFSAITTRDRAGGPPAAGTSAAGEHGENAASVATQQ